MRPPTATLAPILPGRPWPTPDAAQAEDHYWLSRPFGPEAQQWPVATYLYGATANGQLRVHYGVDTPNAMGTAVLAVAPASVVYAGDDAEVAFGATRNFYGQLIILLMDEPYHDEPLFVLYGHVSEMYVEQGAHVERGQPIGAVGMEGIAMGPHLHLEVRLEANSYQSTRNPALWLETLPGLGTIAGRLVDSQGRTLPEASVLVYQAGSPEHPWRVVPVYADDPGVHPDDGLGENFVLGDVAAGSYRLTARVDGRIVSQEVVVEAGETTFVDLAAGG